MLWQRVATALVLLPPLVAAIWLAPAPWLYGLFGGAALLAAWEWTLLLGVTPPPAAARRAAYVVLSAALLAAAWLLRGDWSWLLALACLWWLTALSLLPGFPANLARHRLPWWLLAGLGEILWLPTVAALCRLREMPAGAWRLLFVFVLVWAADVGAYFAGRRFGRRKLAPRISPGKTLEGAVGGVLLSLLWAAIAMRPVFGPLPAAAALELLGLCLAAALLSIVGDLSISMFKRLAGVKDTGRLLPGHGGILDRIDSLMAVAPLMALGLRWLAP